MGLNKHDLKELQFDVFVSKLLVFNFFTVSFVTVIIILVM